MVVDGGVGPIPLLGGLPMRPSRLHRRGRFLLCVAAVFLGGCVSQGKYDALESKYTTLQRQYTELQSQYTQQQQAAAAQAAKSSADIAALKKDIDAGKVHVSRLQ